MNALARPSWLRLAWCSTTDARRRFPAARMRLVQRLQARADDARFAALATPDRHSAALLRMRAIVLHERAEFLFLRGDDEARALRHLRRARDARDDIALALLMERETGDA